MRRVILRRKSIATLSVDDAVSTVLNISELRIVDRSGETLLVEVDRESVVLILKVRLDGWVVSLQTEPPPRQD